MADYTSFLRQCDISNGINREQLALLSSICMERRFQAGQCILNEGEPAGELYLIIEGAVDALIDPALIAARDPGALEPVVVEHFRRGQSFGEMSLLDEGARSASVSAVEDTRLLLLPREALLNLLAAHPDLGYRFMLNLAIDLSQKVRRADLRIREESLRRQGGQIV